MSDWATAVAGLGGAALGIGGTWWLEALRRTREDSTRWVRERRLLYLRFIEVEDALRKAAEAYRWHSDGDPSVEEMQREGLDESLAVARRVFLEVQLIGGQSEIEAAKSLHETLLKQAWQAENGDRDSDQVEAARKGFIESARRSMLLPD